MKKFQKLLIASLLIGGMTFSAAGCKQSGQQFVPPSSEGEKVTINDAYDWNDDKTGSNRPNLGGDYEAQLPPTEAVVTISESSSVRFKGGLTSITLPVGKLLKAEDFEESTLGGKTLEGVAALDGESKIVGFHKLEDFVPLEAVTVVPYFAPEHGDAFILGSNRVGDYYYDENGVDLSKNPEYTINTENVLVNDNMGRLFTLEKTLNAGSYFRCVTVLEREGGQQYTYYYTVENRDDKAVSFTIYQMNGGHDWADPETAKAGDPVTLQPGEKITQSFVVDNEKNDSNTLTLIKFDENCEGFKLAVAMAMDNTTATQPATITLDLPAGFTVSEDYVTAVRTNDKLTLPKVSQITNQTGHKLLHWEYADGTEVKEGVRIKGDITIKPVLTEDAHITFDVPANFTISADYLAANSTVQTGDKLTLPTAEQFSNQTGVKFIRWVDGDGNPLASTFTVTGSMTIKAEMAQRATITVKLPAGLTLSNDYNKSSMTGEKLVAPTNEQVTGTIADGRQILGWYIVGEGNTVITDETIITNPDITIAPYFTRRASAATMCNFEDYDGHELVFSNIQSSNKPMNVYGNAKTDNFNAVAEYQNIIAVGAGDGGYAEFGNYISYSGTLEAGDGFRCGTKISDGAAVVKLGVEHTFYYNFENLGTNAIHLTLQAVNSGTSVEGPVNAIDLQPGESKMITFKVTYTKGDPNKNVLSYFTVTDTTKDMKLGVSVNVVLGKEKATVSLKDGIEGFTLNSEYLAANRYVGDALALPTQNDYTDAKSADRTVIGWKDAAGNDLHDGDIITGNLVLVPVFEEYVNVTIELPEGITLNGYDLVKRYKVGDKFVLPTEAQITNTIGRDILFWKIKGTNTVVNNQTVIEGAITVVPEIAPEVMEEAIITLADVDGFSLSSEYLAIKQYVGGLLVLPEDDDITNTTGKKLAGWKDAAGNDLTANTVITGNIELHPVLVETVTVNVQLPNTITLKDSYKTVYDKDAKLVLPTSDDLMFGVLNLESPAGWYNVATNAIISGEVTLTENITIAPYWSKLLTDSEQVKVGSGSAKGVNTDEMVGNLAAHFDDKNNTSAKYAGWTTEAKSNGVLVIGNDLDYTVLGSAISDTQKITAGSAIRLDSKYTIEAKSYEFRYTVQNRSTTENLRISIYQIAGSAEYKVGNQYYGYESRYRVDINLAPGESISKLGQYALTANGNALTYIVFEEDVNSCDFGIAMCVKAIDKIDNSYQNQDAIDNDATIAYDKNGNGGIEVKAEWLTKRAGKFVMAPGASDVTIPEGVTVIKWQLVVDGTAYDLESGAMPASYDKAVLLPSSGATLKAVLAGSITERVTVNVNLPQGITLKDSYETVCIKETKLVLPMESDLDFGTTGMGAPTGWYNVATNEIISGEVTLTEDLTIAPYWQSNAGYSYVQVGSGSNSGYNTDEMFGDLAAHLVAETNPSAAYSGIKKNSTGPATFVKGDYTLLGSTLSDTAKVTAGTAIRLDSTRTLNTDGNYEYVYTVQNKGTTDLWLSIYQINASSEYKKSSNYYGYESRYRTEVKVAAGNAVTVKGQYNLEKNGGGNMMTYIVFEKDVASFSFGISIGYKEISEIAEEFKNQPAIENNETIAYNKEENSGIEVNAEWLTKRAGKFVMAPGASDITVPAGVAIKGWQLVVDGTAYDLENGTVPSAYNKAVLLPSSGATLKVVYMSVEETAEQGD